jgi:folate-binding protein YgfZ
VTAPQGVCVIAGWPTLRVFGPDAASWLNGIVSSDVASVCPGRGSWGTLLTKQGKITAELQIVGRTDELFVAVSGGDAEEVLGILNGYLVMEDAEIEPVEMGWFLSTFSSVHQSVDDVGNSSGVLKWGNCDISYVLADNAGLSNLVKMFESEMVALKEWNRWLTDQGIPQFGVDYNSSDNLHAASLERLTVDWKKGCYLGQEVVCMQDMRGKVRRRLVSLQTSTPQLVTIGDELQNETGESVGRITSVGERVALGSVRAPEFTEGTLLSAGDCAFVVAPLV